MARRKKENSVIRDRYVVGGERMNENEVLGMICTIIFGVMSLLLLAALGTPIPSMEEVPMDVQEYADAMRVGTAAGFLLGLNATVLAGNLWKEGRKARLKKDL